MKKRKSRDRLFEPAARLSEDSDQPSGPKAKIRTDLTSLAPLVTFPIKDDTSPASLYRKFLRGPPHTRNAPARARNVGSRAATSDDPRRRHDVTALTSGELERTRRELAASLALTRPGSPARAPIQAHLVAIDAERAARAGGSPGSPAA